MKLSIFIIISLVCVLGLSFGVTVKSYNGQKKDHTAWMKREVIKLEEEEAVRKAFDESFEELQALVKELKGLQAK